MYVYMVHFSVSPLTPATPPRKHNNAAGKGQSSKGGSGAHLIWFGAFSVFKLLIFQTVFQHSALHLFASVAATFLSKHQWQAVHLVPGPSVGT